MKKKIIKQIRLAFAENEYPGDWCLKGSTEGDEPYLLEEEFRGKTDWTVLDAEFLNQSPDGFATALCLFSDEAFRFYLPAYLIADIQGKLGLPEPVFHLTHGLDDESKGKLINPRRYGGQTWFDHVTAKFAMFPKEEVEAIVAYLHFKMETSYLPPQIDLIAQALNNYWIKRQQEAQPRAALYRSDRDGLDET